MTDIIERMARAWKDEEDKWHHRASGPYGYDILRMSDAGTLALVAKVRDMYEGDRIRDAACAKAALSAIREPSEEMVEKGNAKVWGDFLSDAIWRAMVDAARGEG